jgi:multiple sugar transport system permease protein
VLLVVLSVIAACAPAQKPVTIRLWEFPRWLETPDSLDRFYWLRQQIRAFEASHPGVSIELTELTWERGADKERIAIAAGVGPDIVTGTLPVQLVQQGFVEPVNDYMTPEERADFFEPALDAFTYDGKLYGWPWYLTGSTMFINLGMLERNGMTAPEPDWTYQQFLELAGELTRDRNMDGKPDTYGFGFLVRPGDTNVWPFLFPDGIGSFAGNRPDLQELEAECAPGLRILHDLIHQKRVAPIQSGAWDTLTLWQHFADQQDIAMAPWGIWAIPKLRTLEGFDFDVLPYPRRNGSETGGPRRAFIGTAGFMVLRQPDAVKRKLCMEFSRFLVRPQEQHILAKYGVFPSRPSAGNIYDDDGIMARTQRIITSGQSVPRHASWAKIDEKLQKEIQLALLNEKSIETALSDGVEQIRTILEKDARRDTDAAGKARRNVMPTVAFAILVSVLLTAGCILLFGSRRKMASMSAYGFLLPALAFFSLFMLLPLCWVFLLAFQDYSIAEASARWTGLQNMRSVVQEEAFVRSALNTLIYALVVVPVNTFSALVVASLIYPLSNRMRSFFRGAYYLPGVASIVVIAMVWRWMFNENLGVLNTLLGFLGLPGIRWLTNPDVALWSVIITSIARPPGGPILIYLAALDAIPTSLYDAGEIDGAGPLRKWWHITVPLLRPTTLFLALTITIASFQVFAQVLILTDGGPGYATEVIVHRIYTAAIRDFDFGIAAAMSLILFIIIMLVSVVQYRFFRSEIEY